MVCDRCGQEQSIIKAITIRDRMPIVSAELHEDPAHPGAGRNMAWVLPADPWPCENCGSIESAAAFDYWMELSGNEPGSLAAPR